MAFDGLCVAALQHELSDKLTGGRIFRIQQPESDALVLTIKPEVARGGGQVRLLLSANPSLPLVYLTSASYPMPFNAPAFCMLLRKHLQNGRIVSITQPGLERILRFEVEHYSEMGDLTRHTLVIELMGKHSNILFLDDQEVIVDAVKHISQMVSSVREVLPGRPYFIPETQAKRNPLDETAEGLSRALADAGLAVPVFLQRSYTGLSTVLAEEIVFRSRISQDRSAGALDPEETKALHAALTSVMEDVKAGRFLPTIYYRLGMAGVLSGGEPQEFSAIPLTMYKNLPSREFASMSPLLEEFYAKKGAATRIRQKSQDLRKITGTILERNVHKYDLQRKQLQDTKKRDQYRIYGELLNAYGYSLPEGAKKAELENYYTGEMITVPLDPTLSAQANAKRYFDRYTKLKRTEEALLPLMEEVAGQIEELREIRHALDVAQTEADLRDIRRELEDGGYVRRRAETGKKGRKEAKPAPSKPLHYRSSDGYDLYVGKNNLQNDYLTFHFAKGSDIWFHANDMPGSHVILLARGQAMDDIPDNVFTEAASLAAYYSTGRDGGQVEIDYCYRRELKKPAGARPGYVIYHTNYSILVGTDISALTQVDD